MGSMEPGMDKHLEMDLDFVGIVDKLDNNVMDDTSA